MSKKALISVLVVVILVVLASFSFMPKLEASAAASSEIVGSWIRQRNTSTGTSFQIYQFNKDGTGCWAQDGVSGSFDDNYKKFTYTYDPSNNQLIINDTEYFCSICENGMIISSGRAVLIVFTRAWYTSQLDAVLRIEKVWCQAIRAIASEIRFNASRLDSGDISEVDYVENCLWLSLEAMVKLLSSWLAGIIIPKDCAEFLRLAESVSDLAFEYGRYMLYAKEQAILNAYIQNQYVLDEQLQCQYEAYLAELNENAARFQGLIDDAFSSNIRDSLMSSAALARAAGVKEDEILTSIEDVDAFFLD